MVQLLLEELIEKTGGCGRFQVLLCIVVHTMKCIVCFSLLFMIFGSVTPDWWCADDLEMLNSSMPYSFEMNQYKNCRAANGSLPCTKFIFDTNSIRTLVSEWNLVCDKGWIPSTITSIQSAGVFLGNLACGQVADLVGKKKPLFFSLISMIVLNIISAFSTSWLMMAILKFFIGVAVGFELTVQYNVMSEFTQARWRTWVVAIPSWPIETTLFALVAWLLHDWVNIHIATAAVGVPLLASYWFVPESFRWYVGHDRLKDAEDIIIGVAKFNRKPVPNMSELHLQCNEDTEQMADRKYSFIDLFRNRELKKYTLLYVFVWITLGLTGYGLAFGMASLSSNIYINIFIMGLIGSPMQFVLIYLNNRIGRKATAIIFFALGVVCAFIVAVAFRFEKTPLRIQLINIAAVVAVVVVNCTWSPVQTLTIETYPTVVRNMGYGLQNTMARIGAIAGPQLAFLEMKVAGIMYWICGVACLLSIFCLLPIPETRGIDLVDKLDKLDKNIEIKLETKEKSKNKDNSALI